MSATEKENAIRKHVRHLSVPTTFSADLEEFRVSKGCAKGAEGVEKVRHHHSLSLTSRSRLILYFSKITFIPGMYFHTFSFGRRVLKAEGQKHI